MFLASSVGCFTSSLNVKREGTSVLRDMRATSHCKYHAPAAATPHASASNILLEFICEISMWNKLNSALYRKKKKKRGTSPNVEPGGAEKLISFFPPATGIEPAGYGDRTRTAGVSGEREWLAWMASVLTTTTNSTMHYPSIFCIMFHLIISIQITPLYGR